MLRYATVKHFQFLQMFSFFPKSSFLGSSTSVNSNNPYFFQNFQNFQLSAAIYYGKLREEIEKEFVAEIYKEIDKTEPSGASNCFWKGIYSIVVSNNLLLLFLKLNCVLWKYHPNPEAAASFPNLDAAAMFSASLAWFGWNFFKTQFNFKNIFLHTVQCK